MVMAWKSQGLSDESIKLPATPENSLNPKLEYFNTAKFRVESNESFFFAINKIINLNITYGIKSWPYRVSNNFTLRNSLFGVVKLTENVDPDKHS